ncbi:hypothetical protein JKP88DRAFT_285942 [Tribonema minus]|uniref:Uncharacterized protein n=1 Tax=Tribonema minus TaxID=303371 RepID=A0A835ZCL9_9STRA|nr:hypothetical protein JKP88DRAFT_285942 [Tribonema minus]
MQRDAALALCKQVQLEAVNRRATLMGRLQTAQQLRTEAEERLSALVAHQSSEPSSRERLLSHLRRLGFASAIGWCAAALLSAAIARNNAFAACFGPVFTFGAAWALQRRGDV